MCVCVLILNILKKKKKKKKILYICVKLPFKGLNSDHCPPHPIRTYTCRVIFAPMVCDDIYGTMLNEMFPPQKKHI